MDLLDSCLHRNDRVVASRLDNLDGGSEDFGEGTGGVK